MAPKRTITAPQTPQSVDSTASVPLTPVASSTPATSISQASTPAPESENAKRRRLEEEFEAALGGVDFSPSAEVSAEISATLKRRQAEPVRLVLFTKADRVPLGFAMVNTIAVREEMLKFLALPDGHGEPFFINDDVLARKYHVEWPKWPRPAWYHAVFCTVDEIPQLQPMLLAYRKFFDDHGYDVVVEKIAIRDDKELLAWRCMQPSEKYSSSKRVLPPAASAPAGDDEEKGFEP